MVLLLTHRSMTTSLSTAPTAATKKAAKKEFTLRGQLLTRIAQGLVKLGDTWGRFSGLNRGPVYEAQANGHAWRGYLTGLTPAGLCIQDVAAEDMTYYFRLGQLSTGSLAQLAEMLA